jgi:hypothetical protein
MKTLTSPQLSAQGASLDSILRVAGAHNWSAEAIEAHKASELAKAPYGNRLWTIPTVRAVAELCHFAVYAGGWFVFGLALYYSSWPLGVRLVCVIAGIAIMTFQISHRFILRGPAKWSAMTVDDYLAIYNVALPAQARRIVDKVKHFRPSATCNVHVLTQDTVLLDPILEVDGRYPLVWDDQGNIVLPRI